MWVSNMRGYVVDKKNLKTPNATHKVEDIVFDPQPVLLNLQQSKIR